MEVSNVLQTLRDRTRRWFLLPLALLLLAGCSSAPAKKAEAPSEKTPASQADSSTGKESEKKGPSLSLTYTNEQTGLNLKTPSGWEAQPVEGALVALISPQNGVEDLFRENILITRDDKFPAPTMASYLQALSQEVRKRYADTETAESGEIEIDGIMAHWMVDTFTGPKGPSKVYRVVLLKDSVPYVFHATALAPTFDLYRPTFEAIAKSISWPKPS